MTFFLTGHKNEVAKNDVVFFVLPGATCSPGLLLGTFGPLTRSNHDKRSKQTWRVTTKSQNLVLTENQQRMRALRVHRNTSEKRLHNKIFGKSCIIRDAIMAPGFTRLFSAIVLFPNYNPWVGHCVPVFGLDTDLLYLIKKLL